MENSLNHWRLNPSIFNSRRYSLIHLRKHIEFIIQNYVSNKSKENLLDYGCGDSPYKKLFLPVVEKYIGADIEENSKADLKLDKQGKIPTNDSQFGFVLSTQVLEHVDNPEIYLTEARRILKKDGLLLLTTHGYWFYHPTPNDYWRWTSAGLKKIISDNNFEIIYFKGLMNRGAAGLQLFQDHFLSKLPKFILPLFAIIMQSSIWFIDKLSSQNTRDKDACIYVVLARRKN